MHVHTYIHTYNTCIHAYNEYMHTRIYMCTRTYIHIIPMYVCVRACMCTHTHTLSLSLSLTHRTSVGRNIGHAQIQTHGARRRHLDARQPRNSPLHARAGQHHSGRDQLPSLGCMAHTMEECSSGRHGHTEPASARAGKGGRRRGGGMQPQKLVVIGRTRLGGNPAGRAAAGQAQCVPGTGLRHAVRCARDARADALVAMPRAATRPPMRPGAWRRPVHAACALTWRRQRIARTACRQTPGSTRQVQAPAAAADGRRPAPRCAEPSTNSSWATHSCQPELPSPIPLRALKGMPKAGSTEEVPVHWIRESLHTGLWQVSGRAARRAASACRGNRRRARAVRVQPARAMQRGCRATDAGPLR